MKPEAFRRFRTRNLPWWSLSLLTLAQCSPDDTTDTKDTTAPTLTLSPLPEVLYVTSVGGKAIVTVTIVDDQALADNFADDLSQLAAAFTWTGAGKSGAASSASETARVGVTSRTYEITFADFAPADDYTLSFAGSSTELVLEDAQGNPLPANKTLVTNQSVAIDSQAPTLTLETDVSEIIYVPESKSLTLRVRIVDTDSGLSQGANLTQFAQLFTLATGTDSITATDASLQNADAHNQIVALHFSLATSPASATPYQLTYAGQSELFADNVGNQLAQGKVGDDITIQDGGWVTLTAHDEYFGNRIFLKITSDRAPIDYQTVSKLDFNVQSISTAEPYQITDLRYESAQTARQALFSIEAHNTNAPQDPLAGELTVHTTEWDSGIQNQSGNGVQGQSGFAMNKGPTPTRDPDMAAASPLRHGYIPVTVEKVGNNFRGIIQFDVTVPKLDEINFLNKVQLLPLEVKHINPLSQASPISLSYVNKERIDKNAQTVTFRVSYAVEFSPDMRDDIFSLKLKDTLTVSSDTTFTDGIEIVSPIYFVESQLSTGEKAWQYVSDNAGGLYRMKGEEYYYIDSTQLTNRPKQIPVGTSTDTVWITIPDMDQDGTPDRFAVKALKMTIDPSGSEENITISGNNHKPARLLATKDFDGDGKGDLLVKDAYVTEFMVYGKGLVPGHELTIGDDFSAASVSDPVRRIEAPEKKEFDVAFVGDITGDSQDDIILRYKRDGAGTASDSFEMALLTTEQFQVMVSSAAAFPKPTTYIDALTGTDQLTKLTDNFDIITPLWDVNGDGIDDFFVRSVLGVSGGYSRLVVYGEQGAFAAAREGDNASYSIDVVAVDGSLTGSLQGIRINDPTNAAVVQRIAGLGDINGDGYADVIADKQILYGSRVGLDYLAGADGAITLPEVT